MDEQKTLQLGDDIEAFILTLNNTDEHKQRAKNGLLGLLNNTEGLISFDYCRIGDAGAQLVAKCLKHNTMCSRLILYNNNISADGCLTILDTLRQNTTLTDLDMQNGNISNEGCMEIFDALRQNTSLANLCVMGNNISDEGCRSFAEALRQNSTLTDIMLSFNKITDAGCISIADGLKKNKTLIRLDLCSNLIGTDGILYMANMYKTYDSALTNVALDGQNGTDIFETKAVANWLRTSKLLGKGHFGTASLGEYESSKCVIKTAHELNSKESLFETLVLKALPKHQNVVKLFGICDDYKINDEVRPALVLGYCGGGSLQNFVTKLKGKLSLEQQFSFAQQMALALEHLHKFNMVHRDLAMRNFVLTKDYKMVILIDFGLAFVVKQDKEPFLARDNEALPFRSLPPETMYQPQPFYKASDIWMLGVTFWQMYQSFITNPFNNKHNIIDLRNFLLEEMVTHRRTIPLNFPRPMPQQMGDLVNSCCNFDYEQRPTATQILEKIEVIKEELDAEAKIDELQGHDEETSPVVIEADGEAPVDVEQGGSSEDEDDVHYDPLSYEHKDEGEDGADGDYSPYYRKYGEAVDSDDGPPSDYYNFMKEIEDDVDFTVILDKYRNRVGDETET